MWWLIEISVPATTVSTGDFTLLRDEDSLLGDHEVTRKNIIFETHHKAKTICVFRVSRPYLFLFFFSSFCFLPDLYPTEFPAHIYKIFSSNMQACKNNIYWHEIKIIAT